MADIELNLEGSDPKELVAQAIRAFATRDFSNAALAFGKASELLAHEHGDQHDSLGEIHVQYAKALLELYRLQSEPLGDAIPRNIDSDLESDEAEIENGGELAADNDDEIVKKKTENGDMKENGPDGEKESDEKKSEENIAGNSKETEEDKSKENIEVDEKNGEIGEPSAEADDEEKSEDLTDLQLAWEVLEVAKSIFLKRGTAGKELLSETMILLGEVAMESENFTAAISDMKEGLELQKTFLEPTSRKLAESYYKLGTAFYTIASTQEALENFQASIKLLKDRIEFLEKECVKEKDKTIITDKKAEIEEIKALIPEIEEKINDTTTAKEDMALKLLQEINAKGKTLSTEAAASSSTIAKDITHLVKRKRKSDEESAASTDVQQPPTKKPSP